MVGGLPAIGGGGGGPTTNVGVVVTLNTTQVQQGFQQLQGVVSVLRNHLRDLDLQFRGIDRVLQYMAAGSLAAAATGFLRMAGELEQLQLRLQIFEGSSGRAAQRVDELIDIAGQAPFSLRTLTEGFVRLRAAGLEPLVGPDGGRGLFHALIDATAAFGGSDQVLQRAFVAIQQMAGKGVISMEELRQQLGEAIPSAIQAMAVGMNRSVSQLIQDITRGRVEATEGLNAMARVLNESFGGAAALLSGTFLGSIQRVKTEITRLADTFNRIGGLDVFTAGLQLIITKLRQFNDYLRQNTGQALTEFGNFLDRNSATINAIINTIGALIRIVGVLGQAIMGLLSMLPPESLAAGFIGYIFFGRAGALLGAAAGPFIGAIEQLISALGGIGMGFTAVISSLGASGSDIATMGLLGYLLFGRAGGLITIGVTLIDGLLGYLNRRLAELVASYIELRAGILARFQSPMAALGITSNEQGESGESVGTQAGRQAREDFMREWTGPGTLFGDLNSGPIHQLLEMIRGIGPAADSTMPSLERVRQVFAEITATLREGRAGAEGMFRNPQAALGLTPPQIQELERFARAEQTVAARLETQRLGEGGGFLSNQRQQLERVQGIRSSIQARLAGGGLTEADTASLNRELDGLNTRIQAFERNLGQVRTQGRAVGRDVFGELTDNIRVMRARLEDINADATLGPLAQAATQVDRQFEPMVKRINEMRHQMLNLGQGTARYREIQEQLIPLEQRLSEVRAQALGRAQLLAQRQVDDANLNVARTQEQLQTQLAQFRANLTGDRTTEALERVDDQFRTTFQNITDQIRDLNRQVEDGIISRETADQAVQNLNDIRAAYEGLQSTAIERARYETTAVGELWRNVGNTIEESVGGALEALVTRTGNIHDILTKFYNDITRAAINYLLTEARMAVFGAGGSLGQSLFGALAGSGSGTQGGLLSGAVTGIGSWLGGLFAMGSAFNGLVKPFARGDIIRGPTLFGIAGEEGGREEGIFPMGRDRMGRLGVYATGGGSGGGQFNINIQAVDAASVRDLFMRSGSELVQSLQHRSRLNRGPGRGM